MTLILIAPLAGCEEQAKPPVIDLTTPIKDPATPKIDRVAPLTKKPA